MLEQQLSMTTSIRKEDGFYDVLGGVEVGKSPFLTVRIEAIWAGRLLDGYVIPPQEDIVDIPLRFGNLQDAMDWALSRYNVYDFEVDVDEEDLIPVFVR